MEASLGSSSGWKDDLSELGTDNSTTSLDELLISQQQLFHSQLDQLRNIVVSQCRLTGVNPLAQEMAAGALSIKIGKRPRDLLNPKAIKYMQLFFSVKDTISKKESREIGALFGVTVTQIRDFFANQRSRVRKLARISKEKVNRPNENNDQGNGALKTTGAELPINLAPLNFAPPSVEDSPTCSSQDETLQGMNDSDKHFVDNIFNLMRKEETFTGQVKLMDWILQIENSSVLQWFSTKGGLMILATWLSEAAVEEQTSVLHVILKVLNHLPLQNCLPVHTSAILQGVNRLRFYRTSDVSNKAKALIARWSKMLARSQALKKPNGLNSSSSILKNARFGEITVGESWQSNIQEELGPSFENAENVRKLEPTPAVKLLTAATDDSSRKNGLVSSQTRERRKVQLVEQPGQKTAGRSPQAAKAASVKQSRPLSADDIQKAKMRAYFMQSKYGKNITESSENKEVRTQGFNKPATTQTDGLVSKVPIRQNIDENKKPAMVLPKIVYKPENTDAPKARTSSKEMLLAMCKRVPWRMPPEMRLDASWMVGAGDSSKEDEVQKNRIRREKETIYLKTEEIPPNPKDPWDIEMDFDDSLTPEVPSEQPPDSDATETPLAAPVINENNNEVPRLPTTSQINCGKSNAEPDLELLAVLLKNPELVFALTSGQAGNLSADDTAKLLDLIKSGGGSLVTSLNEMGRKVEEKVEVSLPSPTPHNDPGTSGWRSEHARNPFSQQSSMAGRILFSSPPVASTSPTPKKQPQIPASDFTIMEQLRGSSSLGLPQQVATSSYTLPQTSSAAPSLYQTLPTRSQVPQASAAVALSTHHLPDTTLAPPNLTNPALLSMPVEGTSHVNPMFVSERQSTSHQKPRMFSASIQPQRQAHPQPSPPPHLSEPRQFTLGQRQESWRDRPGMASNGYLQANQYNASVRGRTEPRFLAGAPPVRDEMMGDDEFEDWSPETSPRRPYGYNRAGMNIAEPRMNHGRNYMPDRSRQHSFSGFQDHDRHINRRWRDRR